jgi:uncharacterized phiE125 gp8 family phage protein
MALTRTDGPDVEPVSLVEAKAHLRVDISDDDALIGALIVAAREMAEAITRRALITQTWVYTLDSWPRGGMIAFPMPPLQDVGDVDYTSYTGVTATLADTSYVIDTASEPGRLRLKFTSFWPSVILRELAAIEIEFDAGYGDDGAHVPQAIRQAMLLMIGHWYEKRELMAPPGSALGEIPFAVQALLSPYRVMEFA